jgi:hypothetical protein
MIRLGPKTGAQTMKSKKPMRDSGCYIMGVGLLCGGYGENELVQERTHQNPGQISS